MLPSLRETRTSKDMVNEFRGYNHNLVINENEFFDMANMTSDYYPSLSPRKQRGIVLDAKDFDGMCGKEKLCWASNNKFFYNGALVGNLKEFLNADGDIKRTERQFVPMGAFLLIFPDKKYFNAVAWSKGETEFEFGKNKLPVFGSLEHNFQQTSKASFILSTLEGAAYDPNITVDDVEKEKKKYTVGNTAPEKPANGDYWLDTSGKKPVLEQYAEATSRWVGIATTFLRIQCLGIGKSLNEYDTVEISGCTNKDFNGDFVVFSRGDDYIVIAGILDKLIEQDSGLKVTRAVPDMDFVAEGENRIWGCSSAKHEIYACKLGDPWNWKNYMGLSTDSYAVTVGSDGDFTGACTFLGYLFFFKEEVIHRVYGTMPSNYNVQEIRARGVERGSEKSIAIVNETLYYKSRNGIMTFDGSLPESVNYHLGNETYSNAVAGDCGSKYYVSMKGNDGYRLFVYDQNSGLWHVEDNTQAKMFCRLGNELYYIDSKDNMLKTINGSLGVNGYNSGTYDGEVMEKAFNWFIESGNMGLNNPDKKYISKLQLRLTADAGTTIKLSLQYDSCGFWEDVFRFSSKRLKTYTIPIIPKRCDHLKIKISGKGNCKIFSLTKSTAQGSEV